MPILKMCRRCKKLIEYPKSYCEDCQKIVNEKQEAYKKARESKYNKQRDPKYKQFYQSKEWQMLSARKMQQEQYRCEFPECKKLCTEVHHKVPIQCDKGWERRLDYENLEALCLEHHNFRHSRFQKRKVVKK